MPVGWVTCPLLWAATVGAAVLCGVSLTTGVLLPRVYGTIASPLWLEMRGPAAWQTTPSWAVCRHACHRLLPWLRVTFAMVSDAARPGLDRWPWSTSPATSPAGRLGRPSASDPRAVVCCALSPCRPRCVCVFGVPGHLALVHRCARCVRYACVVCSFSGDPRLLFAFLPVFFFLLLFCALVLLYLLCIFFCALSLCTYLPLLFFLEREN